MIRLCRNQVSKFNLLLLIALTFSASSCDVLDYNPHEIILEDDERDLIEKGIVQVQKHALDDDTIVFVMTGDTQGSLDEVNLFVDEVNALANVDFTLICGDLSNYGLLEEYRWLHRELKRLNHPYIPVIGNHDFIANGPEIFKQMYGPFDYTFNVGVFKFIAVNTNSLEFGMDGTVPNMIWLNEQLRDTVGYENIFVFSHVMPWNDAFDPNLEMPFANSLAKSKVKVSFHGHNHNYEKQERYDDGVTYIVTGSTGKNSFILVKLWDNGHGFDSKQIFF